MGHILSCLVTDNNLQIGGGKFVILAKGIDDESLHSRRDRARTSRTMCIKAGSGSAVSVRQ